MHLLKTINIAQVDAIKGKLKTASNPYTLSSLAINSSRWPDEQIKRQWCSSYRELKKEYVMAVTNSRGSFYRGVNFIEVSIERESTVILT